LKWSSYKLILLITFLLPGLYVKAQFPEIDSLNELLPNEEGEDLARIYLELAKAYTYRDPSKMIGYAEKAMPIAQEHHQKELACYADLLIGKGNLYAGNFEDGKKYISRGLELAFKLNHAGYICSGLNSMGTYYMSRGDYDKSLQLYRQSLKKAEAAGLKEEIATEQLNIGTVLTSKGERTKGLRYLLESLKYFEKKHEPQLVSRVFNNIAVNYHAWKDYDKALQYYKKTLKTYHTLHDDVGQATVLNNMGEIFKDKKEYRKALCYYQRTINIVDSTGIGEYYKAFGWIGQAETYGLMNEDSLSLEKARLAIAIFEKAHMQEGIAQSELILSRVYLHRKNYRQSMLSVNRSLELAGKMENKELEQKAYQLKSMIYADRQLYPEAYEMLRLYTTVSDTLYQEEQMKELVQLRTELEITEKENEIELLQKNNQIKDLLIKRQQVQTRFLFLTVALLVVVFVIMLIYIRLRKQASDMLQEKNRRINEQHLELIRVNETKDKFLSIISHDLRNPVGAFKDMVGQLADFPEMFSAELRQQIIGELREEAENTYFLLDNLLSWAESQKDNIRYRPEKLDLGSLINNNILLYSKLAERKQIRLTSNLPEGTAVFADHNMVNLILRNLISNAIKFTDKHGEISVSTSDAGEFIEVQVTDSGIGILEKDIPKLFQRVNHISTYGTNHEKGSGLGLLLCKEFTEIHGGMISARPNTGKGSTFFFTLKKFQKAVVS